MFVIPLQTNLRKSKPKHGSRTEDKPVRSSPEGTKAREEEEEVRRCQRRDFPVAHERHYGRTDQKVQVDRSSREELLCNDHK